MTPYLRQVARHYHSRAGELSRLCFIFPNRRAVRFFEQYLGEEIAASGTGPCVAPGMYTVNDFFCRATGESPAERTELLILLHKCYQELNPQAEPLDDFIFWGDALLGDFDDVDKYLVCPEHLFTNISDIREIRDDYSYLSDTQREAVRRFVRHFQTPGAVKDSFVAIWKILLPLYENFRNTLRERGLSYEGMVYRDLAESIKKGSVLDILQSRFSWHDRFVFVGLNALNECEKTLLRSMHKAGVCEFCWDWRGEMIRDAANKSSFFLREFTAEFPSAFEPDPEGLPETEFNLLSVPGGIAQAKQIPRILARCTGEPGIETAIVLPDEQLLIPVLNSIPESIRDFNVTMGYPISGSQIWSLVGELGALQLHLRQKGEGWYFYHRPVWAAVSNPIVRSTLSDNGRAVLESCRNGRKYYIPREDLSGDPVLEAVFRPVALSADPDADLVRSLCLWLQNILSVVAPLLKNVPAMELEIDFAKVCHETLGKLLSYDLPLRPASFFRLLSQLLGASTVPFEGEPLAGMQIMGPLELRALDFKNLIILSCNEGVFPRRSVSASFIPPDLRTGFGLPTYEYQDAVWAYYFYRAIQRSDRVWMVYDSRTEGLKGGEPSRYIKQLQMHFGLKIRHFEAVSPLGRGGEELSIEKKQEHLDALSQTNLSASSVKNYLDCPVRFFYSKVEGLKAEKEVSESLDAAMTGTVLHETMQELYPAGTLLDAARVQALRKDKRRIREAVERHICEELKTFEVSGRNIIIADVICSYVDAILRADQEEYLSDGVKMRILGAERTEYMTIGGYRFVGVIDRLDSTSRGEMRVVDYKTGRVEEDDLRFNPKAAGIPKIGLQLYLYKRLMQLRAPGANISGAIYQPALLMSGEKTIGLDLDEEFCSRMDAGLLAILSQISDLSVPWTRTEDTGKCKMCDFRAICGR